MANDKRFSVNIVIGAVDEITYKVMAINEKLKKITEPMGKLKTAFSDLGRELGVGKFGQALMKTGEKWKQFTGDLSRSLAVFGALGYGVFRAITGTSELASQIADAANRIGVSTDAFQAWNYQAVQAGLTTEDLEGSLIKFSKSMGDAAISGGADAELFKALGVSIRGADGQIRSMEAVLPEVAKKLQGIQNPTLRNKVLMELFGKSGAKMAEFLSSATEKVSDSIAKLKAKGAIISAEDIAKSKEFGDQLNALHVQFNAVKVLALSQLLPPLLDLLGKASAWLTDNKDKVAAWAREFAKDLPGILEGIGSLLRGIAGAASTVGSVISWLNSVFGTANVTMGILTGMIFGKTIVSFVQLGISLFNLGKTALPLLIRGLTLAMPWFSAFLSTIWSLVAGFAAIVGWPATIAIAIGGLAVLLYNKWKPFKDLVDGIWDKLKSVGGWALKKLGIDIGSDAPSGGPAAQGAPLGASLVSQAAVGRNGTAKTENHLIVDFNNMPKGTRVQTEKAETPLDLNLGYGMVSP